MEKEKLFERYSKALAPVVVTDIFGQIVFANEQAAELFRAESSKLTGMKYYELLLHNSSVKWEELVTRLYANGFVSNERALVLLWDDEIPISVNCFLLEKWNGEFVCCFINREQEIPRLQNSSKLEIALSGSRQGIWEWDVINQKITVDANITWMLGYEPQRNRISLSETEKPIHPDDYPELLISAGEHFEGITPFMENEMRILNAEGEWIWFFSRARLEETDSHGNPSLVIGILQDIQDRKLAREKAQEHHLRLGDIVDERTSTLKELNDKLHEEIANRRETEISLMESEKRFRMMVESSPFMILSYSREGEILFVNTAFSRVTGIKLGMVKDLRGLYERVIRDPNIIEMLLGRAHEATRDDQRIPLEVYSVNEEKQVHLWEKFPLPDGSIIAMGVDITKAKEAEEELRRVNKSLNVAMERADLSLWYWDKSTDVVIRSESWKTMLGYAGTDIVDEGEDLENVIHPDDKPLLDDIRANHKKGGFESYEIEYRLRTKDGKWKWVLDRGTSIRTTDDGEVVVAGGTIFDITARKGAEEESEKTKALLRQIVDIIPYFILIKDSEGRILLANRAYSKSLGYLPDDIAGKLQTEVAGHIPEEIENFLTDDQVVLKSNHGLHIPRQKYTDSSNELHYLSTTKIPITIEGDTHVLAFAEDITSYVNIEEELKNSELKWKLLFDSMPGGSLILDRSLNIEDANGTLCKMVGYSREELINEDCSFLYPDREALLELWNHPFSDVKISELELKKSDGTGLPVIRSSRFIKVHNTNYLMENLQDVSLLKKTQQELAESREMLQLALKGGNLGIWNWDRETGIITRNDTWASMLGYDPTETPSDPEATIRLTHPDDVQPVKEVLEKVLSGELNEFELVYRLKRKDGRWAWILDRGSVMEKTAEGLPLRIAGSQIDVTTRIKSQLELEKSETFKNTLIETSPIGISVRDRMGRLVTSNQAWKQIWGISDENDIPAHSKIPHNHFSSNSLEPEISQRMKSIGTLFSTGGAKHFPELKIHALDGTEKWVSQHIYSLNSSTEEVEHIVVLTEDITKKKDTQRSFEIAQKVLDGTSACVIGWENKPGWPLSYAIGNYKEILGYSKEEIDNNEILIQNHIHPEDLNNVAIELVSKGKEGDEVILIFRMIDKDENEKWIQARTNLIIDKNDSKQISGFQSIIADHTEEMKRIEMQRKLDIRIQRAQKVESLAVMAGGIAHDFNNLLAVILGNADMAARKLPRDSSAQRNLSYILEASESAAKLCQQMVSSAGKGVVARDDVSLNKIVRDTEALIPSEIMGRSQLKFDLMDKLPRINADKSQIQQILVNLITNGFEAIDDKDGFVLVSTRSLYCGKEYFSEKELTNELKPGEYVLLEIHDSGIGMNQTTINRIFDPFFTTKFVGRGLGMAAVLGIVRTHDGAINIRSREGKGTRITVYFPALVEVEPVMRATRRRRTSNKLRFLIIDDDVSILELAQEMFSICGYDSDTAKTGEQAIEKYRQNENLYDFILLDMTMPEMDGAEIFERLKKINGSVKVIVSSGYSEETVYEKFKDMKPYGFLKKTYHLDELKKKLGELTSPGK